MPVLAPAPSLGVSLVHGVIARGRRCWPAGRTRASSASLAPRVHPDYTYRSCSRAGRYWPIVEPAWSQPSNCARDRRLPGRVL